jgi:hypothetical protein
MFNSTGDTKVNARLVVKHKLKLMEIMIDLFCCDTLISFEGELSQADLRGIPVISREPTSVLKRNTIWPKSDFIIIPITCETKDIIKKHLLPRMGIATRVNHIQIERQGVLVFSACDNFDEDCVWVTLNANEKLFKTLVEQGILWRYKCIGSA